MNSQTPDQQLSSNKEIFTIDPETLSISSPVHRIFLTNNGDSWIDIEYLPEDLQLYATENFDILFNLRPLEYGKTLIYQKQVTSHRYHQSYLNTPKCYIDKIPTSYMFSGFNESNNQQDLPDAFHPFYQYMINHKDSRYNQVVANWYQNGNDYIAQHSDCEIGMIENAVVSIMNFNASLDKQHCRILKIKPKAEDIHESIHPEVHILLRHACMITMGGKFQQKFKHGVPKISLTNPASVPRFSLSFRQFQANEDENEDDEVSLTKEAKNENKMNQLLPLLSDSLI